MILLFLYKAVITKGNYSMDFPVEWWLLVLASFFGPTAEATEILLLKHNGCLLSWRVSSSQRRRQLNSCSRGAMDAFDLGELDRVQGSSNSN